MARIVLIHGIGQQGNTRAELEQCWLPSLVKGVLRSGHPDAGPLAAELAASLEPGSEPVASIAFYGHLFLPNDVQGGALAGSAETETITEEFAVAVLHTAAARGDDRTAVEARRALHQVDPELTEVQGPGAIARSAVAVLDNNRWLAACIFGALQRARPDLTQVARYLTDTELRAEVQSLAAELIDQQTRLIIGHSLGSVVAWEACMQLSRPLPMLITLGSPLGLDSVVYPRLRPQPPSWPTAIQRWVNVAHRDDFIAVEPALASLFRSTDDRRIEDHFLDSKHEHHAESGYLEEPITGFAVAEATKDYR